MGDLFFLGDVASRLNRREDDDSAALQGTLLTVKFSSTDLRVVPGGPVRLEPLLAPAVAGQAPGRRGPPSPADR